MIIIPTLDGVALPRTFKYKPYEPVKRIAKVEVAKGVIVQSPVNTIVHGTTAISWTAEMTTPSEFMALHNKFNTAALTFSDFKGRFGEHFKVTFQVFQASNVRGNHFDCNGEFFVHCVVVPNTIECLPLQTQVP